ncbi:hypothetical protein GCM10020221_33130 [Streptomyces thioluteus]|uniref:Uncharacterized protein n=1 Tax=Streptomyces thioluteus TaxID=66431 RepID=A0ABN3X3U7_STRTU
MGMIVRANFTVSAAPLAKPPAKWVISVADAVRKSSKSMDMRSVNSGFFGAFARAAFTAEAAASAALLRCLRAAVRISWACCILSAPALGQEPGGVGRFPGSSPLSSFALNSFAAVLYASTWAL